MDLLEGEGQSEVNVNVVSLNVAKLVDISRGQETKRTDVCLIFVYFLYINVCLFVCFRCRSGDVSESGGLWNVSSCLVLSEFCSEKRKN